MNCAERTPLGANAQPESACSSGERLLRKTHSAATLIEPSRQWRPHGIGYAAAAHWTVAATLKCMEAGLTRSADCTKGDLKTRVPTVAHLHTILDESGALSENAEPIAESGINCEKLLLTLAASYAAVIQRWNITPMDEMGDTMAIINNLTNAVLASPPPSGSAKSPSGNRTRARPAIPQCFRFYRVIAIR